jgi:hypothetical protein
MSTFGSNIDERKAITDAPKYRKTDYLKLTEGEHRVRILDNIETKHYTHYMGYAYVACLGEDCPICQSNKKILYEHPDDYRNQRGWNPRRDRYYINVIDKTPVKVCANCGTESGTGFDSCPKCGGVLGTASPANKVRVLTGSRNLFEDLKVLSNTVRDDNDEILDIRTYDWTLVTRGQGREKTTTPSPRLMGQPNNPDYNPEDLFDLSDVVIRLTPEEMLDVANGTSIKDIFVVRRAAKQVLDSGFEDVEDIQGEIRNSVNSIFKS